MLGSVSLKTLILTIYISNETIATFVTTNAQFSVILMQLIMNSKKHAWTNNNITGQSSINPITTRWNPKQNYAHGTMMLPVL